MHSSLSNDRVLTYAMMLYYSKNVNYSVIEWSSIYVLGHKPII